MIVGWIKMAVIAVNFNSIEARNDGKEGVQDINVNSVPSIVKVKKHDKLFELDNVISIEYSYATKYDPDIGNVTIKGEVIYSSDKAKQLVDDWDKNNKLDEDVGVEVMNAIFRRCLAKTIEIASDIRLPPPIRFPSVVKQEDAQKEKK
jgi:hypothetical protein